MIMWKKYLPLNFAMLQDFRSVSDPFTTLRSKGLSFSLSYIFMLKQRLSSSQHYCHQNTVKCSQYALFVIYLLMSYSPFGNSFQWELLFYWNQSIHFFCTWFYSSLSDVGFLLSWIYVLTCGLHLSFAFLFISQTLI